MDKGTYKRLIADGNVALVLLSPSPDALDGSAAIPARFRHATERRLVEWRDDARLIGLPSTPPRTDDLPSNQRTLGAEFRLGRFAHEGEHP